ncbi:phage regulatory CII family protein [Pseudomonas nitroreducens]|uniref:Uncharacterized protein n=1 Tax=Pseudomonas nitroreducens TaxID=46680 RepID=A0A6G6IVE8_PSENT|nr:phage regulatory CII family protein [Pseudomonas nitroreducens]QIE86974.1 hypothetical protein G5B91_12145 [Pseudomonas nitroreducens]
MSRKDLLPDAGPVFDLRQALYRAGRDYKGGLTSLAHDMVLPYEDLQKKLKLDEERRWPTPDELEEIIRLTRDPRLLDALTRPADVVWYRRIPVDANAAALRAVGELLQREGEFVASLHRGSDDSVWEPHEVTDLEYHGANVIRAVLGIMSGARQSMERRQEEVRSHG